MTDPLAEIQEAARQSMEQGVRPTPESLAAAAGISRSTYFRLVGSHREFLASLGWEEGRTAHERILAAAVAMIDEVGIAGLVMDTVAARADTSRATLYRLFPNKEALWAALARDYAPLRQLPRALEQMHDRDPAQLLPQLLSAALPQLLAGRGLLRAIMAEASMAGLEAAGARTVITDIFRAVARYLEAQMDAGRLRRTDPLAAVQALLGPVFFYVTVRPEIWAETAEATMQPAEVVEEHIQIWLRGMQPGGE